MGFFNFIKKLCKLTKITKDSAQSVKEDCIICFDQYPKETGKTLECGHTFHPKCIDQWISEHKTCPICRHSKKPTWDEIRESLSFISVRRIVIRRGICIRNTTQMHLD